MYLSLSSPAAVRLLAAIKAGEGINRSARLAGLHTEVCYRLLRDRYLELRRGGLAPAAAAAEMGLESSLVPRWEALVDHQRTRHHRRHPEAVEQRFWAEFESGQTASAAARAAGVPHTTGGRWLRRRFDELRSERISMAECARRLRLRTVRAEAFEKLRQEELRQRKREAVAEHRAALATAARHAELTTALTVKQKRRQERVRRYWQLMREGLTNAAACRILGMSRRAGSLIRKQAKDRIPPESGPLRGAGRYLQLRERVQIADLRRLGFSMRKIAEQLGRAPSTISRELRRHSAPDGTYLPATADHDAHRQRTRPKTPKLASNKKLRKLVQRKLNRHWSPQEISGWLRRTYPDDALLRICHETIYRDLLTREGSGLEKSSCARLRTGRRIRKHRWRQNHVGTGSRIRNMMMIHERPAEAADKRTPGHWEGDLVVGTGSASAMITLRERTTHYGIVINLPLDHTSATVNTAIARAFARVPKHLKRSLTWDQGVEMAGHEELTRATGVPVYFAERSSPWQRGANENFNGLLRQYFPKGTDLSRHSREHVARVMRELNARPRKTLGYDTPSGRFNTARTATAALR